MTDTYLIIKTVSDTMDAGTLLMTQIALAMASFSSGVSILLLVDWFKRHGWAYKHKTIKNAVKAGRKPTSE